ncbi:putative Adenylate kinase 7 [Hypsibius exemplaris]|uniref:Adenylate kinase 7 n=1 Tax=Hypsibius exemplaris TaxID=2072580 RepID=A0A1W0WFM4_HYPEX|nr:putative Adenylate kinase 7 [Hypsibius exemplaris]
MVADQEYIEPPPPPKVFISRVDTYFGRILAQHLGRSLPGETGPESEASETKDPLTDPSFLTAPRKDGAFEVSGSWRVPATRPDDHVGYVKSPALQNLVYAEHVRDLTKAVQESAICVLNVHDDDGINGVFEDACTALDIARNYAMESENAKTMILISTTMTWAKTRRPGQEEGEEPPEPPPEEDDENVEGFNEEDYKKRRPHPAYRKFLELEKDFLKAGRDSKGLLTTTIIAAGLIYGCGEDVLHWMLKDAWQGEKVPLIVPGDREKVPGDRKIDPGKNHVPTIHARDLCQVVQNVCDNKLKSKYIFAVDDGKEPLNLRGH